MPNLATVVLTDRKATPVAHSFLPRASSGGVGVCVESTPSGSAIGENQLTISSKKNAQKHKAQFKLAVRKIATQTVNGVTTDVVLDNAYVNTDATFGPSFTDAEKNDIIGMHHSAFAPSQTFVMDIFVKGNSVFG